LRSGCVSRNNGRAASFRRRGTVSVTFILTLPIFLCIIAILVQYALMLNARIMVQYAAETAARSAVTAVPDQHEEAIARAARTSLVTLSPQATTAVDPEATAMADAMRGAGIDIADSFAPRYTYAKEATQVSWVTFDEGPLPWDAAEEVTVTVRYRFQLTVPFAARIISGKTDTVAGVTGRFFQYEVKVTTESAHGRMAGTDAYGWPN
jgi:Flp pilus assembly protein TadG